MLKEKTIFLLLISFLFVTGCSQNFIRPRVLGSSPAGRYPSPADSCSSVLTDSGGDEQIVDSSSWEEGTFACDFETAEFYYALGVGANQEGKWTKAQEYFEKALDILSGLDIEGDSDSLKTKKINRLLHEIAKDYEVTLLSVDVLSDETSISAFLQRFENIQNFKKLREDFEKKGELDSNLIVENLNITVYDMPIEWNERVEDGITYFQTVARGRFETYMRRSGKYLDLMQSILKEKGLPGDLVWLCLVESGFNPKAYSWARAMGPWQFIASTGKKYGLKKNWWYDERRDFVKSTYAACDYLSFLYNKFGSWSLALAGYNCGEGRVEKAMQKHNSDNFWELKLRKQTEDYVPLYMAATIIAKSPEKYGFDAIECEDPIQFDIVEIDQPVDLKKIAKMVGTSVETMQELNPELLRGVTPPHYPGYKLRIPPGTKELFTENLKENPSRLSSGLFVEHKIKKGETLSGISKKYGVPLSAILDANAINKKQILRVGQHLLIPNANARSQGSKLSGSYQKAKNLSSKKNIASSSGQLSVYTVKKGETLSGIAIKFNTNLSQIKKLNNLKNPNSIRSGQRLRVPAANTEGKERTFVEHKVKKGETLSYLAEKYGVSVSAIMEANDLSNKHRIKAGQCLLIPTRLTLDDDGKKTSNPNKTTVYAAKKDDTTPELALRSNASSQKIEKLNSLENLDLKMDPKPRIPVRDQKLNSEKVEGRWIIYVVKRGDTLWDIARKFGVLLEKLITWNELDVPSRINVGDRLKILKTH
jgi:membrane-bound lytic murein transglycosylase D